MYYLKNGLNFDVGQEKLLVGIVLKQVVVINVKYNINLWLTLFNNLSNSWPEKIGVVFK